MGLVLICHNTYFMFQSVFRKLDYKVQAIIIPTAIITCLCSVFLYPTDEFLQVLIGSYFIVGGLQLISLLCHIGNYKNWSVGRKAHGLGVLLLLLGLISPILFYTLIILLFGSPLLAIWYVFISKATFLDYNQSKTDLDV